MALQGIQKCIWYSIKESSTGNWLAVSPDFKLTVSATNGPDKFSLIYALGDQDRPPVYCFIFSHSAKTMLVTNGANGIVTASSQGPFHTFFGLCALDGNGLLVNDATVGLNWKRQDDYVIGASDTYSDFTFVSSTP